ncbi:hypothetical protein ACFPJ1_40545 [Kribbella qitaiheensis]|uniref:hypothetical protein n=1 Tax=Kribbella qitaiheensis TaxID=1544730 RepID=UPI003605DCCE
MSESMSPGELRGLATFLISIRDDWQPVPVRAALEKLQGCSLVDVAEACTEIARNRSNQYPVMLAMKGAEMIRAKHQQGGKRYGGGNVPDEYKCDICGKARSICQSVPTNRGGRDHAFISAAQGDDDRDQMHADGRIAEARAEARAEALERATAGMFALPRDVKDVHIPQDPKRESA